MIAAAMLLTSTAMAQSAPATVSGYVEEQSSITAKAIDWQIDGYVTRKRDGDQTGASLWFLATDNYWEVYAGPTWSPRKWIEVGVSAGLEKDTHPWRVEQSLWLGHGRVSGLLILEEGGSGLWYKATADYQVSKRLSAGYLDQRFKGRGPEIEYKAGRVRAWGAFLMGGERKTIQVGVQFSFP